MPDLIMKSNRIKNWPVKERPRERLIAVGPERLTDAELLAIILRVGRGTFKKGIPGQNATDFSKELLTEFKGLRGLDRAHIADLLKVPGLNNAKVSQIDERPNVYCEVRYAKSKGIPFILTFHKRNPTDEPPWNRKSGTGNKVHFDLAAYRYIPYNNPMNLRDKLKTELDALFDNE